MKNDKQVIGTVIGSAILVVLSMTAFSFVWVHERGQPTTEQPLITSTNVSPMANQEKNRKPETKPSEVGSDLENISTDGWKLFTDKKVGYSIEYPTAWMSSFLDGSSFFVKELKKNEEDYPRFGNVLSDNLENLKNIDGDYFINVSVYPGIGDHARLQEWRKYNGTNYKEVSINGYPALRFDERPHKSYDGSNKDMSGTLSYYFIDNRNNGYEITIWYKNYSNRLGDKIISTLKIAS